MFVDKNVLNAVAVTSRGWGKSHMAGVAAITAITELLELDESVPNKHVYIIAPTFDQVTDIYYPLLMYQLGMESYVSKHSKFDGKLWFPKNVELRMVSFEAVERMRGKGAYFVVNDEPCSWTKGLGFKEAWQAVIQPCISTRWSPMRAKFFGAKSPGRSLTIGTPTGFNFLYDMFNMQELDKSYKSYHFDYTQSPLLDPDEIEKIRHTIDPIRFAREYKASFEDSGNNVFYCFNRKIHVRKDIPPFAEGEDVHIGIDFNVGLQCSSVFALRGKQMHFIDEFKGHPDTETLAIAIRGRYPKDKHPRIFVYPDPTGKSRKTSAPVGVTDFTILSGQPFNYILRARNKSPAIVDSVAAVNRMLMTAAGECNMFALPSCSGIITSLERTSWVDKNPDTLTIDKTEGVEHFSDGIRYSTEYLFPILSGHKTSGRGFGF
jgi:hypothetical protein